MQSCQLNILGYTRYHQPGPASPWRVKDPLGITHPPLGQNVHSWPAWVSLCGLCSCLWHRWETHLSWCSSSGPFVHLMARTVTFSQEILAFQKGYSRAHSKKVLSKIDLGAWEMTCGSDGVGNNVWISVATLAQYGPAGTPCRNTTDKPRILDQTPSVQDNCSRIEVWDTWQFSWLLCLYFSST